MRKKIEVTIRNDKGEITYYQQQVVDGNKKIQIPLGKIFAAQREKVDDKQPIH